jgi:hypothetical protein
MKLIPHSTIAIPLDAYAVVKRLGGDVAAGPRAAATGNQETPQALRCQDEEKHHSARRPQ